MPEQTPAAKPDRETASSPWLRRCSYVAWLQLVQLCAAVVLVRNGKWEFGLALYAFSAALSAVLLLIFALMLLRSRDRKTVAQGALPAVPGSVLLILALQGAKAPPIHDISTDLIDPPRFERAPSLRGAGSNPLVLDPEVMEQQHAAYPGLDTLRTARSFTTSYNKALRTARALGWEITREDPNAGFIEAVDRTALMNFADDIVIRVRTNAEGSLVDLRSVSRVGISDLGANAARIERFLETYRQASED
jgi:hypothetical protein